MADSNALQVAVAAYQAYHFNGMPECDVNLAHAVVYLSMAPKSNAHNYENKLSKMQCLPDALVGRRYYRPTMQGKEAEVKERLEEVRAWKEEG